MRKGLVLALATILLVSLLGCGKEPGGELTPPSPPQQAAPVGPQASSSQTTPAGVGQLVELVERYDQLWIFPHDQQTLESDWVGLDEKNQVVVAGDVHGPDPAATGFRASPAEWFKEPSVARVLIRQEWAGTSPSISLLSRERYSKAGGNPSFPSAEWQKGVDLYAEVQGPAYPRWTEQEKPIRTWLAGRLGSRLVDVKLDPESIAVGAVVKAEGKSVQERVAEITDLLAGLFAQTGAMELTVEYQGATTAHRMRATSSILTDWVQKGADQRRLAACLEIDGKEVSVKKSPP
jgi:hypothetical protein